MLSLAVSNRTVLAQEQGRSMFLQAAHPLRLYCCGVPAISGPLAVCLDPYSTSTLSLVTQQDV